MLTPIVLFFVLCMIAMYILKKQYVKLYQLLVKKKSQLLYKLSCFAKNAKIALGITGLIFQSKINQHFHLQVSAH